MLAIAFACILYTLSGWQGYGSDEGKYSLLNFIKRIIRLRKSCPEIGYGDWKIIDVASPHVLTMQYQWMGKVVIVLHNLSNHS